MEHGRRPVTPKAQEECNSKQGLLQESQLLDPLFSHSYLPGHCGLLSVQILHKCIDVSDCVLALLQRFLFLEAVLGTGEVKDREGDGSKKDILK